MTTTGTDQTWPSTPEGPPDGSRSGRRPRSDKGHPRTLWDGVRTVAGLELRQRVRTSRWPVLLGAWLVTVYGIAALLWLATRGVGDAERGVVFYSVTVFYLLGLGMLVVPALTATSINADRDHGVLAVLQVTLLSPAQIVLGKALAAWVVTGLLVLSALPVLLFAVSSGGVSPWPVMLALVVLSVVLASTCAVGLCFSTLTARPVASVVLTYLTVGFLTLGTLLAFALITPLFSEQMTRTAVVWPHNSTVLPGDPTFACATEQRTDEVTRSDRTWGLLSINPFVVVADAAPSAVDSRRAFDPMGEISRLARSARRGPPEQIILCMPSAQAAGQPEPRDDVSDVAPLWPWGLTFFVLIGGGALYLATRRVTTPVGTLPRGIRIA